MDALKICILFTDQGRVLMFEGGYMGMDCAQPTACLNTLQYRLLLTHVVTKPE
jgi:hypothetical protein